MLHLLSHYAKRRARSSAAPRGRGAPWAAVPAGARYNIDITNLSLSLYIYIYIYYSMYTSRSWLYVVYGHITRLYTMLSRVERLFLRAAPLLLRHVSLLRLSIIEVTVIMKHVDNNNSNSSNNNNSMCSVGGLTIPNVFASRIRIDT